jgi:hypothetical protein
MIVLNNFLEKIREFSLLAKKFQLKQRELPDVQEKNQFKDTVKAVQHSLAHVFSELKEDNITQAELVALTNLTSSCVDLLQCVNQFNDRWDPELASQYLNALKKLSIPTHNENNDDLKVLLASDARKYRVRADLTPLLVDDEHVKHTPIQGLAMNMIKYKNAVQKFYQAIAAQQNKDENNPSNTH